MAPASGKSLRQRVARAAEAALADHQYASVIDVLVGLGWMSTSYVEAWRKGRVDTLTETLQVSPEKLANALAEFDRWGQATGLRCVEAAYVRSTREGARDLVFVAGGGPQIDALFRKHFVSPEVSERKREKLQERLSQPAKPAVFEILRDSQCSECGTELPQDSFLFMEAGQPLCLACAHLDELEYLPAGDAALTRRATKYSGKSAVVVRFSRSRGHYERQGILVEPAAIEKAELECAADAEERAARRAQGAAARKKADRDLVERMVQRIRELFPHCPQREAREIAGHTAVRGSGRVGRTAAGRNLEEKPLTAAVIAAIRHRHTPYDTLLASGEDRDSARRRVAGTVESILDRWS